MFTVIRIHPVVYQKNIYKLMWKSVAMLPEFAAVRDSY